MSFKSSPYISVLLATYNGEEFLEQQLDSIFNQTYNNFELVIQDDMSKDSTLEILQRYEQQYKNKFKIVITQNQQNVGFKKNFALLLQQAKGDFIALCDQDDIWHENKLEILLNNIGNYSLIYSNSKLIDAESKSLECKLSEKLNTNFMDYHSCLNFLFENSVSAHAMLFNRELLNFILPFPEHIYFDAWIASIAASLGGVKHYNKCLVKYRQHSNNSLSRNEKKKNSLLFKINNKYEKKLQDRKFMILRIAEFMKIKVLNEHEIEILNMVLNHYYTFKNSWFNFTMFLFLLKNKDVFFQISKKNKLILCIKQSIGSKLYRAVPFL